MATTKSTYTETLRAKPGLVLAELDTGATPGFKGGQKSGAKKRGEKALAADDGVIAEWQEKLFAESRAQPGRALLLVIQGMDTAGKGGIMTHVVSGMNPEGVIATAFKSPSKEEQRHHYLWRIRRALPHPGGMGIFDRSHYEDVLVVRVNKLVPKTVWSKRYDEINAFEAKVAESGTTIVKVMLHLGRDEQKARLAARLRTPEKHYKYNPGDITERTKWGAYQEAYQAVVDETSTEVAPWFVVPADHKWYARYAVQQLVIEAFERMAPTWPDMGWDVEGELARLEKS